MTDVPSPPFALPLRNVFNAPEYEHEDWGIIRDAHNRIVLRIVVRGDGEALDQHRRDKTDPTAKQVAAIIRAVNNYDKMRQALEKIRLAADMGLKLGKGGSKAERDMLNALLSTCDNAIKEIDNG